MSGNKLGIKSAKGTGTSGYITKSSVNVRNKRKTHRYLHESDMEKSDDEKGKPGETNLHNNRSETTSNVLDILTLKKEQMKQNPSVLTNSKSKIVYKYTNKLQDYIEDNYIDLGDDKQLVLDKYKLKLAAYFEDSNHKHQNHISLSHDLLNYKKQLQLLLGDDNKTRASKLENKSAAFKNQNSSRSTKPRLEY